MEIKAKLLLFVINTDIDNGLAKCGQFNGEKNTNFVPGLCDRL